VGGAAAAKGAPCNCGSGHNQERSVRVYMTGPVGGAAAAEGAL
jgi:hypothetical protein